MFSPSCWAGRICLNKLYDEHLSSNMSESINYFVKETKLRIVSYKNFFSWRVFPEFNVERVRPYLRRRDRLCCHAGVGPPPPILGIDGAAPCAALESVAAGAQEHQVQELLKLAPRSTAAPLAGLCSLPVAPVFSSPVRSMISLQLRLPSASLISKNRAYYIDSPLHHQVSHNPIFKANKDSFS